MLQVISIRAHRILDFIISLFLIGFSWLKNFSTDNPVVPGTIMMAGIAMLSYGLFTKYKKKGRGYISIRSHLLLDFLVGISLAVSPWLFGFSQIVYSPHVAGGLVLIALAIFSCADYKKPSHRVSTGHSHTAS
jgi:hypothetical protein